MQELEGLTEAVATIASHLKTLGQALEDEAITPKTYRAFLELVESFGGFEGYVEEMIINLEGAGQERIEGFYK